MQSRPWNKQVEDSKIIYEWKNPETKITFFLASEIDEIENREYVKTGKNNETSIDIAFNHQISRDKNQIRNIKDIFIELSRKDDFLPDALGVCLDFFCHMQVQFPDFTFIPGFQKMLNHEG